MKKTTNNEYKSFSFSKRQVSEPWTNKQGVEMVSVRLSKQSKENLGIPEEAYATINVNKQRVMDSKFQKNMAYIRVNKEHDINVYTSIKKGPNDYEKGVTAVKGDELADSTGRAKEAQKESEEPAKENEQEEITMDQQPEMESADLSMDDIEIEF